MENKTLLQAWVEEDAENRKLYMEEGLILDVTEQIWDMMDKKGWTKTQLAEAMDVQLPHVSRLLNGGRNMTLRTLANIVDALDAGISIRIYERGQEHGWQDFEAVMVRHVPAKHGIKAIPASNSLDWTQAEELVA